MDYNSRYKLWCDKVTDEKLNLHLKAMKDDEKSKENAFYKDLEFGTGGLRGEIGVGTNCLNIYTIAKVTQGIADCMKKKNQKVAAISCDSRINSDIFMMKVAEVFASNGIKAYVTRELMPTPFISYMTRQLKADIGVMITASHNPAKYNGYKVYGSDGCQLTDDLANEMISYIDMIDPFKVASGDYKKFLLGNQIEIVGDYLEQEYMAKVRERSLNSADGISIVYSPLNGAGYRLVPQILKESGVKDIYIVKEQGYPDGNFTTCSYPNPEKPEALKLGLKLAEEKKADLLIATDPDCDRMGIAVLDDGQYKLLTGNEVGVLMTDYIFSVRKQNGTLPKKPVIVKTIVSTDLALKVASEYNAEVFDVLTGFKYIGDIIGKLEANGEDNRFVLGFEESYGYLSGSYVRDKDAVVASMITAEMTAYFKKQGKTLVKRINEIYAKFGTYEHKLKSFEYPGAEGNATMKRLLSSLRENLPSVIGGQKVVKTIDYMTQCEFDLPKANVLSFVCEDGSKLIVRPSGTEPLIKMYITACNSPRENLITIKKINEYLEKVFVV